MYVGTPSFWHQNRTHSLLAILLILVFMGLAATLGQWFTRSTETVTTIPVETPTLLATSLDQKTHIISEKRQISALSEIVNAPTASDQQSPVPSPLILVQSDVDDLLSLIEEEAQGQQKVNQDQSTDGSDAEKEAQQQRAAEKVQAETEALSDLDSLFDSIEPDDEAAPTSSSIETANNPSATDKEVVLPVLPSLQDLALKPTPSSKQANLARADLQLRVSIKPRAGGPTWNNRFPWVPLGAILTLDGQAKANPQHQAAIHDFALGARQAADNQFEIQEPTSRNETQEAQTSTLSTGPKSFVIGAIENKVNKPEEKTTDGANQATSETSPTATNNKATSTSELSLDQQIANYGKTVSNLIKENISYPRTLYAARLSGTVNLGLIFNTDGKLARVLVLDSSGHDAIDESAAAIVRSIVFPRPPKGATPERLRFGIQMNYKPPRKEGDS